MRDPVEVASPLVMAPPSCHLNSPPTDHPPNPAISKFWASLCRETSPAWAAATSPRVPIIPATHRVNSLLPSIPPPPSTAPIASCHYPHISLCRYLPTSHSPGAPVKATPLPTFAARC